MPRTKERDSSSWPTPKAKEVTEDYDQYIKRMKSSKHEKNRGKTEPASVSMAAQLTSWLTPTTSDTNGVRKPDGKRGLGLNTQAQSAWPTPRVADTNNLNNSPTVVQARVTKGRATVAEIASHNVSSWPTPAARDVAGKSGAGRQKRSEERYSSERSGDGSVGNAEHDGSYEAEIGRSTGPGKAKGGMLELERSDSLFWGSSEVIYCRDGKYRPIPTEPEILPLADGIPNRVGILRGAGNAIVPQAAAEIIKAYLS